MSNHTRTAMRRTGSRLYDHGFKRLAVMLYDLALVDWQAEQYELDQRRKTRERAK